MIVVKSSQNTANKKLIIKMHINDTMTSPKRSEGHIWVKSVTFFKKQKSMKYEKKNHGLMKEYSNNVVISF